MQTVEQLNSEADAADNKIDPLLIKEMLRECFPVTKIPADLFPYWRVGKHYKEKERFQFRGELYRATRAHESSVDNIPGYSLIYEMVEI